VRSQPLVAALPRRDRLLIAGCIVLIFAIAWAYLVHLDRQMSSSVASDAAMAKMGMAVDASWGASDVFFTFTMWSVMMIGMMSPSAAPLLLLFAETQARRAQGNVPMTVLAFGLGYITVWFGFSLSATLTQWALHNAAFLSPTLAASSRWFGSAILIAAGAYQLTPAKRECLSHCQSPLGFLMSNWRDGPKGAFQMGLRHGRYCLGCCWALMCVLFAVGVMNLAWVAALSVFILLERTGPIGARVARGGALILIAVGILFAVR